MTDGTPSWRLGEAPWLDSDPCPPWCRVIIDNDFSGDPDDLVQLVHHLLSPSVEIRTVIASHLAPGDPFDPGPLTAANGADRVAELCRIMGLDLGERLVVGAERALAARGEPAPSAAANAIVAEAMRTDTGLPLYVVCGGGLTDVASAYLIEPQIAERLTVIWIGGPEYPGLASPPAGAGDPEYNLNIDVVAAQTVFNDSTLRLWQVPRDVYRQCLVSDAELRERVGRSGQVGRYLCRAIEQIRSRMQDLGDGCTETYALGDSPLVLLTALQSFFQADSSSSDHVVLPSPVFDDRGAMVQNPDGRPIRVYTRVDTRLMFEDLYAKLTAFARWSGHG